MAHRLQKYLCNGHATAIASRLDELILASLTQLRQNVASYFCLQEWRFAFTYACHKVLMQVEGVKELKQAVLSLHLVNMSPARHPRLTLWKELCAFSGCDDLPTKDAFFHNHRRRKTPDIIPRILLSPKIYARAHSTRIVIFIPWERCVLPRELITLIARCYADTVP